MRRTTGRRSRRAWVTLALSLVLVALASTVALAAEGVILIGSNDAASSDILAGTNKDDTLSGRGGDDFLFGRRGKDVVNGGAGNDLQGGDDGKDTVSGGAGNDLIVDGDNDPDVLNGDTAGNTIDTGSDIIASATGTNDTVDCGPGTDIAFVDATDSVTNCELAVSSTGAIPSLTVPLPPPTGSIVLTRAVFGTNSSETVTGDLTGSNEVLFGKKGNDTLNGLDGDDALEPGDGKDVVNGGNGNDAIIDTDDKTDQLNGDDGNDTIGALNGTKDVIDCGPGFDVAFADSFDQVTNCEVVLP